MKRHIFAALVAVTCAAHAEPERTAFATVSADQLKSAYLECERTAATGLVDTGSAASCSAIYEALKERVFGGEFQRLLAWWNAQQAALRTRSSFPQAESPP
jgi:hypothetical protein